MVTGACAARPCRANRLVLGLLVLAPVLTALTSVPAGATVHAVANSESQTVWLCRPGQTPDPCATSRAATSVTASGATTQQPASAPSSEAQKFDCFYVYPTVSPERSANADLTVQPAEIAAAVSQASRFSADCQVWAPMYRQATSRALVDGQFLDPTVIATAYDTLLSAWKAYLAHDNHGRPVVFIGHSQGAAMLIKLLRAQIDPSPRLRHLLVSAIILGGNVQVPPGKDVGGSFSHIPLCGTATQTGCVIAYSTFGAAPPPNALFGRAGQGVSQQSGQRAGGQQVACVNPATFGPAPGSLSPYFLTQSQNLKGVTVSAPWVTYPDLYTATCRQSGGATWLQVTAASTPGDPRPTVTAGLGPTWGYHTDDVNLALGNLVFDVNREEAAYH